jgi:hypothetical protein
MRCAIDAEDENKEVSAVLNLFPKYLGTSSQIIYVFVLVLLYNFACNPNCSADHLNEAHGPLVVCVLHFGNL